MDDIEEAVEVESSGRRRGSPVLIAFGILVLSLCLLACSRGDSLRGTELRSASAAAPFELQDQFGQLVSLADHDGRVVVLAFLYTSCPDVCPIVASQLRNAHRMLGDDASEVAFLAVSVDPERDTVDGAHAFSERWEMLHSWSFLVGNREQLSPIWRAYYIDPVIDGRQARNGANAHGERQRELSGVAALRRDIARAEAGGTPDRYLVVHSAPVYLIDREGRMRVVFTSPLDPEAIVHDIRLLLN